MAINLKVDFFTAVQIVYCEKNKWPDGNKIVIFQIQYTSWTEIIQLPGLIQLPA